jgi:hypothetical protein
MKSSPLRTADSLNVEEMNSPWPGGVSGVGDRNCISETQLSLVDESSLGDQPAAL